MDFEAIETAARRTALRLAARAVEQHLNADHSDMRGHLLPCSCGKLARYAGRREKCFESVLGPLTLNRAYYHCASCGGGFFPRDRALGLCGSSLTPAVTRMIGAVGALISFEEGSQLLSELAGVTVDPKQVERRAESLGEEIARDEREDVESWDDSPLPSTLYLGMDGTGIPMRSSELAGRLGKQPDGTAKTREVKLVTLWSAERQDPEGIPIRDKGSVTYSAAIESAASKDTDTSLSQFAYRVEREAKRRRFDQAARQVVLGDGAPWIWNIADFLFPNAIQIVDRFHAKEHLGEVAKAIWGPNSELGKEWTRQRHEELDAGQLDAIIAALSRQAKTCEKARQCIDYIQKNRHRMDYAAFHARGLCTSTGVVEAGCKLAIGTRLKRAGMHWTLRGANAIIALRCCRLSGRFEDFWERRPLKAA